MGRVDRNCDDDPPEDNREKGAQDVKAKHRQQNKETNPNHDLKNALRMVDFEAFCNNHRWLTCHEPHAIPNEGDLALVVYAVAKCNGKRCRWWDVGGSWPKPFVY